MGFTHLAAREASGFFAQLLNPSKLQLLDGAFGFTQLDGNLTNAFFFGEAHFDDPTLILGEGADQSEESRAKLNFFRAGIVAHRFVLRSHPRFAMQAAPAVGD